MIKALKKTVLVITASIWLIPFSFSQIPKIEKQIDSLSLAPIKNNLDQLLKQWYIGKLTVDSNVSHLNKYQFSKWDIPRYSDSVYEARLRALQSPVPLTYNKYVKRYIELYTVERRPQVENMLGLAHYYFPIFEEELMRQGLPLELKYIPVIESALINGAVSKSGATGLWQFMYGTARIYKLQMTSYIDERRDPYKLTQAAVSYFSDLYDFYQNWLFVIAAYNCGPGTLNRCIQQSGYKSDFWEVYPYLPTETKGYVPAYIAANYVMNYYIEHNLYPKNFYNPGLLDTIHVTRRLSFSAISDALGISFELIKELNPQYKMNVIPQSTAACIYILRLPVDAVHKFYLNRELIYSYQDHLDAKQTKTLVATNPVPQYTTKSSGSYSLVEYDVKVGENISNIAEWFDCTIADLNRWNTLPGNVVTPGRKLVVYVPSERAEQYRKINYMSYEEKQALIGKSPVLKASSDIADEFIYYTIQDGDTLWSIAKKFPGVSTDDLINLNNLHNNSSLKPGQKIKIKTKI